MNQIGIQSKGILDYDMNKQELEEGFRKIKETGFDCIDFNMDVFLMNSDLYEGKADTFFQSDIKILKEAFIPYLDGAKKHGLVFSQMHVPYPVWVYEKEVQNAYMRTEVVPKSLQIAKMLSIPYAVIHPFKMQYRSSVSEERRQNLEFFKSLIPLAKETGVTICLENLYESMGGRLVEGVCARKEEAVWYIDALNEAAGEEVFGFCLDTGHMHLVKENPYDMICGLGHRLKILHLHENDGMEDLHQMPYSYGGTGKVGLDWAEVCRGLREIHYKGVLSFETFPCMNSFPHSTKEQVLRTINEIGSYFATQIADRR